jgi:protein-S-isoprenylcysteine O-methyltransferase Ste14
LPPAPFAAAIVGGWWLDRQRWPLPLGGSDLQRGLGWLLVAAALLLFAWSLLTLRRHRTTVNPYRGAAALCTDGPFAFSRNPIYLADWFVLAGASLILATAWPLLFAPAVCALRRHPPRRSASGGGVRRGLPHLSAACAALDLIASKFARPPSHARHSS